MGQERCGNALVLNRSARISSHFKSDSGWNRQRNRHWHNRLCARSIVSTTFWTPWFSCFHQDVAPVNLPSAAGLLSLASRALKSLISVKLTTSSSLHSKSAGIPSASLQCARRAQRRPPDNHLFPMEGGMPFCLTVCELCFRFSAMHFLRLCEQMILGTYFSHIYVILHCWRYLRNRSALAVDLCFVLRLGGHAEAMSPNHLQS
jgi:hypothetical protein